MATPQLYRQLFEQLGQWIIPKDLRHLKNCAEIVAALLSHTTRRRPPSRCAAILESESACAAHWLPYLSHRNCQARSQMERISYFMNNPAISTDLLRCCCDSTTISDLSPQKFPISIYELSLAKPTGGNR